jgi:perosamine synthetase
MRIPLYQPTLAGREREFVLDCLESNWISSKGKYVNAFERAFADFVGAEHAVAVTSGTVALHVALVALGIGPGDEVIVPTLTYVASVNAITYTGARPVFVDSDPVTWQMDPREVARCVTPRTKAILVVHLYGQASDLDALGAIAHERGLSLVEDCAEAIGTRVGNRHVGTTCRVAAFSFYGNKTITTGEGGMVVTNDARLAAHIAHLRGQGLAANREYWHDVVGYNYRMTNLCAAIGLAQIEQASGFLERKRRIAQSYRDALAGSRLQLHHEVEGTVHSYWMVSALVPEARQRDALRSHLAAAGIETRPLFSPVHAMPMYYRAGAHFPVAEDLSSRGMNLPSWPGLRDADLESVIARIRDFAL